MEYWERRHNESWIARWRRLNNNAPKGNIRSAKAINCGATGIGRTIGGDARKKSSQQFKKKD